MEEKNNSCIILYPSPGIGHLVSMVEFAKLVLCHHPDSFSKFIIFITTAPHLNTNTTAPYMSHVSATTPSITFHHLPTTPLPPNYVASVEGVNFELLSFNNPNVRQALETISSKACVKAFVMDFFCTSAFEVSSGLNIPAYYFFTSAASSLSILLNLPTIHQKITTSLKDLNAFVQFPGIPPIFSSDMSKSLIDRNSVGYKYFLETAVQMAKSDGIIINTFHSLEPRAVTAISDGLCIPHSPTPPIYCIGPLIAEKQINSQGKEECLVWLDSQPSKSVVFLCFGSLGVFGEEQLKEIAVGLENSGHRFLWVVKTPPPKGDNENNSSILALQEPDLSTLLPQGFSERTKGRGLVVKSWAPQVAVLRHDSVGGVVTHCGWNSILEGVCAGIPMIGWPLYAEQRINKVILVEELRAGLGLEESDGGRYVSGAEIEKRVRELMDSDNGERVRHRVRELRDAAKVALTDENGTSCVALNKLITKWKRPVGCI